MTAAGRVFPKFSIRRRQVLIFYISFYVFGTIAFMSLVPVNVMGVGLDPNNTPIVMLREAGGQRTLPIWIGQAEALAINLALEGAALERPLTHDLIKSLLDGLGVKLEKVIITELRQGTYFAQLLLNADGRLLALDARPSDSIALALRTKSPILMEEELLASQGLRDSSQGLDDLAERLRRLRPEDFGKFSL